MSEFKFACPVCGQHIRCDSSQVGAQMECPTCFQKITVPQAPAVEGQKFILQGTKAGERAATTFDSARAAAGKRRFPFAAVVVVVLLCAVIVVVFVYRENIFNFFRGWFQNHF